MSHFSVLVVGDVEEQLETFDENLEVPRYIEYTKEQAIQKQKKKLYDFLGSDSYKEFLRDKEAYIEKYATKNPAHIEYITKEVEERKLWSDEKWYEEAIKYEEEENIDDEGNIWSDRNPNSKWDWYETGGRWAGQLVPKKGVKGFKPNFSWGWSDEDKITVLKEGRTDSLLKKDIKNLSEVKTFAVLINGKWFERGSMGRFGMVSDEKEGEAWDILYNTLIKFIPEDEKITIVDCHI